MSALWPRSLVGRTILVLFLAILVSNGLGLAAYLWARQNFQVDARDRALAERVVAAARLLEDSPPADRPAQIWRLRGFGLRMQWATEPMVVNDAGDGRVRQVRHVFVDALAMEPGEGLRLSMGTGPLFGRGRGGGAPMAGDDRPGDEGRDAAGGQRHRPGPPMMAGGMAEGMGPGDRLHGALRLDDGSWLLFAAPLAPPSPLWTSSMLMLIGAASIAAAAIAAVAVWRASAPLSMFTAAAERLGRDLNAQPLAEAGPEEVARAARAFNAMQARLQQMVRQRTQMLAALSHDLRTPLTRLRLRAELLDDGEQQVRICADLDQIEALITTSLEYVRDAFRDERPAPLDLAVLVQTVCDEADDAGRAVRYRGPEHLAFVARPVALRRSLANLIDNAIKYGQEASVALVLEPASGLARAIITVDDRGPGLPEAELERAFEPFYRADASRSRETGGIGLGLAIARAAAEADGGTVTLANRAVGGLRATLSLPRIEPPGQAAIRS